MPDLSLSDQENILAESVKHELFSEPAEFRSLDTVIDVLGVQCSSSDKIRNDKTGKIRRSAFLSIDGAKRNLQVDDEENEFIVGGSSLEANPVFVDLLKQQKLIEEAVEYMIVNHVYDLKAGVAAVGKVSREFHDSISKVKQLRRQVKDIKSKLGASSAGAGTGPKALSNSSSAVVGGSNNVGHHTDADNNNQDSKTSSGAKTLRELWLKKLECEAVLRLLEKIEIIRGAPQEFDMLVPPVARHCRIGAASVLLSKAIRTMFSDDVAQVQALAKIWDQLFSRQMKAEEILWDSLHEVLYLQNGGPLVLYERMEDKNDKSDDGSTGSDYVDQYDNVDEMREFMDEQYIIRKTYTGGIHIESRGWSDSRMIPASVLDNDLDLEADELRCLDMPGGARQSVSWTPRYTDSTLALRILVDSLKELKRLDDVERFLSESIKREFRLLAQRAQEETYVWVERRRNVDLRQGKFESKRGPDDNFFSNLPIEIQCHFSKLLLSYENVLLRYCHLAQILRYKMVRRFFYILSSFGVYRTE